jgi:hypothetical protein
MAGATAGPEKKARVQNRPNTGVAFEPTKEHRQLVMLAVAIGYTHAQTAMLINMPTGIAVDTLQKHFRQELETGADQVNAVVAQNLFKVATDPKHTRQVVAAIFWLKARAGWRDHDPLKFKGEGEIQPGGDPASPGAAPKMPIRFTLSIGERTPEEG